MQAFTKNHTPIFFFLDAPWVLGSRNFTNGSGALRPTCFMACLGDIHMFVVRLREDEPHALWRQLADQLPRPVTDYTIRHARLPTVTSCGQCYQVVAVPRTDVQHTLMLWRQSLCVHATYAWAVVLERLCAHIFPDIKHTAWHAWRDSDRLYVWLIVGGHVVAYPCFYGDDAACIQSLQTFVRHSDFLSISNWYIKAEQSVRSAIISCYVKTRTE